jgi:DNA-binding NarL/FixJ family response regulator
MSILTSGAPRTRARLMIVDDHEVVRQGIRTLVTGIPDWTVCAEAPHGEDALKLAAT